MALTDVAEARNLVADVLREVDFRAADYDVRMDSGLLEHLYGVLGRLCLELFGGFEIWDQSKVDAEEILVRKFPLELSYGFEEGLGFHVSDGSSDFCYDYVVVAGLAEKHHPAFDFVGDVWHYLDCLSEICSFSFFCDDCIIDSSGRHVVGLGGIDSEETFVVTEVEVGFCSVFSDVAFSVFIGIEGARIDVDIRVEFLDGDA